MIGRRTIKLPKSHMVYWMCLQLLVFSAGQDSTLEKCASFGLEYRSLIGWLPGGNLPNAWRVVGKTVRGCEQSLLSCWGSWVISLHKNQRVFFLLAADGHSLNQTCILSFFFFPTFWVLREDGEWREGQSKWCTEKCLFNCGKKKIRRQIWKQLTLGKWSFNLRNIFQLNFILYQDMVKCDYNTSLQIIPSITATAVKVRLSIFWKWH